MPLPAEVQSLAPPLPHGGRRITLTTSTDSAAKAISMLFYSVSAGFPYLVHNYISPYQLRRMEFLRESKIKTYYTITSMPKQLWYCFSAFTSWGQEATFLFSIGRVNRGEVLVHVLADCLGHQPCTRMMIISSSNSLTPPVKVMSEIPYPTKKMIEPEFSLPC